MVNKHRSKKSFNPLILFLLTSLIMIDGKLLSESIKTDTLYLWGEAISQNRSKARQQAEINLLSKIQVSINSSFMDMLSESQSGDSVAIESETRSQVSNYTGMYLKGLQRKYIKQDNTWTVLAYIHKDSLKKSFNLRKEKIKHYARNGMAAVRKGDFENGLKYLYWGYLLSRNYPNKVKIVGLSGGKSVRPQIAFQSTVSSLLDNIKITAKECYKDGSVIMAPLTFEYNGKPINKAYFNYYSGVGTDYAVIENGKIDIPIYDQPVNDTRELTLNFEYEYINEMGVDPEVKSLHQFYKDINFVNQKTVTIIFPWNKDRSPAAKDTQIVSSDSIKSNKNLIDTTDSDSTSIIADTAGNKSDSEITSEQTKASIDSLTMVKKMEKDQLNPETESMQVLIDNKDDTKRFLQLLVQYKKLGKLSFGNRDDFADLNDLFVVILDKKNVCNILLFTGQNYIDIESKTKYESLETNFKGKRLIWVKELK